MKTLTVPTLTGLWTRSLLALPDGQRDTDTLVTWLQGPSLFVDLRIPPGRPDCFHATTLADLTMNDCLWLATQQGFAGLFRQEDGLFRWHREIDFHPPAPLPDAGNLFWNGEVLVETGHFSDYLEHWHRTPNTPACPASALRLRSRADGRAAIFVRAGGVFMFARARSPELVLTAATLLACVEGAADLRTAQELVDCELSLGEIEGWRITRSSLPFREGVTLTVQRTGSCLMLDGLAWEILLEESA
ncbi:hypothetical protein [Acidocella aromatica]|uniref:Uncharacterized protein n=1 Tax=Acidocella aromatica TaxID=1303579 RepID=A0A840VP30_9PROT|nr:hypothetical protein [Acidocella aromatica]MBB5373331.1 hypothetical protein [Acidocella aromatica]